MPSTRSILLSLTVGLLHAAGLLLIAVNLGYAIGPSEYSIGGTSWRYGGLVLVATLPVWLAVQYRIITPLLALILTTSYVVGMELTPPGPTFHDLAEFERLDEPTGIIIVQNGLYIVNYMVNASVWMVGFLFLGVVEYTVRTLWNWLPPVSRPITAVSLPASRHQALLIASIGGLVHAVVMVWFALRLGLTVSNGFGWLLWIVSTGGMWLLAAVPLYLLIRHRLVAPATLLTGFILLNAQAEFGRNVDDPHVLYFGAWFGYLSVLLVAAGVEYGLRRLNLKKRLTSRMSG